MHPTSWDILGNLLLAAFLGAVGQLIRIVAGLKKSSDRATAADETLKDTFDAKRMLVSLGIAIAIGAIAGILASFQIVNLADEKSTLLAFLSAGYSGSDFIEAFMKRASPEVSPAKPAPVLQPAQHPVV